MSCTLHELCFNRKKIRERYPNSSANRRNQQKKCRRARTSTNSALPVDPHHLGAFLGKGCNVGTVDLANVIPEANAAPRANHAITVDRTPWLNWRLSTFVQRQARRKQPSPFTTEIWDKVLRLWYAFRGFTWRNSGFWPAPVSSHARTLFPQRDCITILGKYISWSEQQDVRRLEKDGLAWKLCGHCQTICLTRQERFACICPLLPILRGIGCMLRIQVKNLHRLSL